MSARRLSVVICVRDAETTIAAQLEALAGQMDDPAVELVVVDDGSTDRTPEILAAWQSTVPGMRVVTRTAPSNLSVARNEGVATARGAAIAMCDADDVVGSRWVDAMRAALETHVLVTGPVDLESLNPPETLLGKDLEAWRTRPAESSFLPFAIGCNVGFRREVFDAVGGFDRSRPTGADTAFSWRIQLAGHRLAFAPDALVYRRLRSTLPSLAMQQLRYGRSRASLFREFRSDGMGRSSTRESVKECASLLIGSVRSLADHRYRTAWVQQTSLRAGRILGSIENRVLYL